MMGTTKTHTNGSSNGTTGTTTIQPQKENNATTTTTTTTTSTLSLQYLTKTLYDNISYDFHKFHQHDMNCFIHFFTTSLGVWGMIQLVLFGDDTTTTNNYMGMYIVYAYVLSIIGTTPIITSLLHTILVYGICQISVHDVYQYILEQKNSFLGVSSTVSVWMETHVQVWHIAVIAILLGYGLQDVSHYVFQEPTYMSSYIQEKKYYMILLHSFYLLPLVIDTMSIRHWFLPTLFVTRNRNIFCHSVTNRNAITTLQQWITSNIPHTPETTHVWPHEQRTTSTATKLLEYDTNIYDAFRIIFPTKHYDILPVQDMNEIYVTAVGAKQSINSDAVFYTPHCDGPYWFLPYSSLYRVLVGITENDMVRTRFNLQHSSQDTVIHQYQVLGFDYNRELHWIDHIPNTINKERRSVLKLHFIIYPKGWHTYGKLCSYLNTQYNTWARQNFLTTLRPKGIYEITMAWWIWLTTWCNAIVVEYIGYDNMVYVGTCATLGYVPFLILTSFRHYMIYICTFAYRQPMVAHGYLMRDAFLYKTISMMHIAYRILPLVQLPNDSIPIMVICIGFSITILATYRLGMVRTYFGTELQFVKPQWITGFPYGYIPHPMIVGQLFSFTMILHYFYERLSSGTILLLCGHMICYTIHMIQEICTGGYDFKLSFPTTATTTMTSSSLNTKMKSI